ncbi:carboxypeptidase-like regulatory domain-containing protein [Tamlana agarivorans]|uniref:Carboxypeptidase-like regulatory domain-containing protein n=1 Tax=Pseudotamlana agarivorans TaxID=481183 RepID=A0ACC5U5H0_9FLAO|nr:MG2 domain-containing protein [Tamlana agarivorans]MBU2949508.1 carboxypeptidase-like regulatory domain-containing protein [Tamlana agarivorans]
MRPTLLLICILFFSNLTNAQNPYSDLWEKVETFEVQGLPKSALKTLKSIEKKAKRAENHEQIIKVMLFKSKFNLILEEDAILNIINDFKSEIDKNERPTKNVLENILAHLYWQYFNKNKDQFYSRTKTSEKVNLEDFRTWDLQTLFNEIHLLYQKSLKNDDLLKQEQLENYSALIKKQGNSSKLRPTLFDFLSHNALEFYETNETHITQPAYKFVLDAPEYLANAEQFSTLQIASKDSTSLQLNALKIYKALIRFHLKNKNYDALTNVDIARIKFVYNHATFNDKEKLKIEALKKASKNIENHESSGLYDFEIASTYYEQSKTYSPKTNKDNRWKAKEAVTLCDQVIKTHPKSSAAEKCEILKAQIEDLSLQITTEKYLPIAKASRLLITYKNLDSLQFYIYKLTEEQVETYDDLYRKDQKLSFLEALIPTESWVSKLRNEHDYQTHTTEVVLPKLNNGKYLVLAKVKKDEDTFAFAHIQVTDFALIETQTTAFKLFQIINRNNGNPIRNAQAELSYFPQNSRTRETKTFETNNLGQFKMEKGEDWYRNIKLKVTKGKEIAYFGDYYLNKSYKQQNNNPTKYKSFIFTDRSIYRPGQTVYFKAIAMQVTAGKSQVLASRPILATLHNVNNEKVTQLELKTNDFGSVSGEFILPNNGLTGRFSISINDNDGHINLFASQNFSVEEYKRPKFETQFETITETFRVNDSITVKGKAQSFSGSNITDAKVVYRVKRKVEYPHWSFGYRPFAYNSGQEITHGKTKTDASGNFEIIFKAIPDESIDKTTRPIFKYEVIADVTDINGETHSETTTINVGYHALTANINIENAIDKSAKNQILTIETKNLNGAFVPTKGHIKIYKLKAPNSVLRVRPWSAPDYQELTKHDFKALFPYEAFKDENNPDSWENGNLVLEKHFNTEDSKTLDLGQLSHWQSGQYTITLESKDKFGQLVKDEVKTTLYSDSDKTLADNELFSITTNKTDYNINESAYITLGTSAENVSVTVTIEKNRKFVKTEIIKLSNNKKTIAIPITKNDVGGFAVHYSFAAYNSYQSGTKLIAVPHPSTNLEIETSTFRDKIQPGSEETWQFKIKGPNGEKVSTELLASMYDASLDLFKSHTWKFNPINKPTYYTRSYSNAYNNFRTQDFTAYNPNHQFNYPEQEYDQFNWYGFDMNNDNIHKRYLNQLRSKQESKYSNSVKKGFVSGTVYDETGAPIPAVTIIIKGTTEGTMTNFDGNFSIEAEQGDILEISYIGFDSQDILIGNKNFFHAYLTANNSHLNEVTVIGLAAAPSAVTNLASATQKIEVEDTESDDTATGSVTIRGNSSILGNNKALYIVDGKITEDISDISPDDILSMNVLKDSAATAIYGSKAKNGVVIITTKNALNAISLVEVRKNLKETAFFFPQLKTDENGNISFSFNTPEALTQWKLQLLAHTKSLESATKTLTTVTQKELMVTPNAPRFLREGDRINISSKIANLTKKTISGDAMLLLTDAISGKDINISLGNAVNNKPFSVNAHGNTEVSWQLNIPENIQAVQYKVLAKSETFSDGEQNTLPVLSNRMLVTESLPMWIKSNETKTFTLDKLKNNASTSLTNHKLTLEVTSTPAWYAVQALPYLMEYPYECNEQTFSKYYANALAQHIVQSNPKIEAVFNQWKSQDVLISNLENNDELKSILIQETPWLRDAQSETEQKKRIALLFDLNKMDSELQTAINKIKSNQLHSGAWPWFNGGRANRYITQHIISGFGRLKKLQINSESTSQMVKNAIKYLDEQFIEEYETLKKHNEKIDLSNDHLSATQLHYLYMRSFFPEIEKSNDVENTSKYYQIQIENYWLKRPLYSKGLMALISFRNNDLKTANAILESLKETSITSEALGMYWKENTNSWFWYQAPIETQALLIEAFSEIKKDIQTIDNLKIWLIKNKQTNHWKTTKATTNAVYALLLEGSDWLSVTDRVDVTVGNKTIEPAKLDNVKTEAGTGYYKTSWTATEINPAMSEVTLTKKGDGIAWGSLYWQYFEDLDKITTAETPLSIKKKLFVKHDTDLGEEITEITPNTTLKVGDLVRVRIELQSDRDMEFLHMKDMRAAGLEPINVISTYKWQDGLGYYESTKDASTNFFIDRLPKGIYVFEYDLRVNNAGDMSNGITTLQSMYAPEFSSHSEGIRIKTE